MRSQHSFILEKSGEKHYMKGGKPGFFPPTDNFPHPVGLNLYDPFNNAKGMSSENLRFLAFRLDFNEFYKNKQQAGR